MTRGLPQAPVPGIRLEWRGTGGALGFLFRACPVRMAADKKLAGLALALAQGGDFLRGAPDDDGRLGRCSVTMVLISVFS